MSRTPRVLSIAGTDPTGGAGIAADLKSISAQQGYGMAVITAVVAQNTQGVRAVHYPPIEILKEQLYAVSDDVEIDAVKVGMLGRADVIDVVDEWLAEIDAPVIIDPVMVATSGDSLLDPDSEGSLRQLLSRATAITPNVPELAALAGVEVPTTWVQTRDLAQQVADDIGVPVIAKGGHLAERLTRDAVVYPTSSHVAIHEIALARLDVTSTHGTGCSLSSAIATLMGHGVSLRKSLDIAKEWLHLALRQGGVLDVGHGNGPVHHFVEFWDAEGTSQ